MARCAPAATSAYNMPNVHPCPFGFSLERKGTVSQEPAPSGAAMFEVAKELRFCYGHRLLNYEGKCRYLHGHNGRAVIFLATDQLDNLGMVLDFSTIKRVVGGWIDEQLDHRLLLHKDDPVL